MSKETVAEQHGNGIAPLRIGRRLTTSQIGAVENVVVHERRGVDEFHDDREIEMPGADVARGTAGQESECRAEAFALALDRVGDITLDGRGERPCLLADPFFDRVELGIDQLEGGLESNAFIGGGFELCEIFH